MDVPEPASCRLFTERIEAVVPERSPEEITAELEEKLTSLLGTPITLG